MSPSKVGAHTARLVVATNDPRGSFGVDLVGHGTTWQLDGTIAARGPPAADEVVDHTVRVAEGSIELISADGTVDAISLDGITGVSIQGGSGNDTLRIDSSGGLAISFSGGDGNDTLSLVGEAADTTWTVTGAGSGSGTGGLSFTGVENLAGAANNEDTFVVETGGSVASVDGGDRRLRQPRRERRHLDARLGRGRPELRVGVLRRPDHRVLRARARDDERDGRRRRDRPAEHEQHGDPGGRSRRRDEAAHLRVGVRDDLVRHPTATITVNLGGGDDALTIGSLGTFAGSLAVDGGSGIDLLGTTRISVALPATTYTDVERLSVGFVRDWFAAAGTTFDAATVLTHGFQVSNSGGDSLITLARAIRDRADAENGSDAAWFLDYDLTQQGGLGIIDVADSSPLPTSSGLTGHSCSCGTGPPRATSRPAAGRPARPMRCSQCWSISGSSTSPLRSHSRRFT